MVWITEDLITTSFKDNMENMIPEVTIYMKPSLLPMDRIHGLVELLENLQMRAIHER